MSRNCNRLRFFWRRSGIFCRCCPSSGLQREPAGVRRLPGVAPGWQYHPTQGNIGHAVRHIRIWVYDGILASGVAGSIDVFTAANAVWADKNGRGRGPPPRLEWIIESLAGKPGDTQSSLIRIFDGMITTRDTADAVIVTAPFVA